MKSVFKDEDGDLWVAVDDGRKIEICLACPFRAHDSTADSDSCGHGCPMYDEDTDDTGRDIAVCGMSHRPIGFLIEEPEEVLP